MPLRHILGNRDSICPYGHELLVSEVQPATDGGIMVVVERVSPSGRREEGGKAAMPTYVALMNWTDQGARTVRDTVHRREQADELAQKHGARIEQVYWTIGPYDIVSILEAPDDESATAVLLELATAGNLRTTTLRAYNREEMSGIIQRLG